MSQWFPAIRAALAKRGLRLPQPYPHTVRTLLGSALAALLSGTLIGIFFLLYSLASLTIDWTLQATASLSRATAEMASSLSSSESPDETTATGTLEPSETASEEQQSPETAPRKAFSAQIPSILPDDAILQEARAPLVRRALPYSEHRRPPFSEAVRQVDFALVQTMLRLNIEWERIVLLSSEYREQNGENYPYQRMRIFLPPVEAEAAEGIQPHGNQTKAAGKGNSGKEQPALPRRVVVDAMADFVGTLEENLDAWARRGILSEQPGKIVLSVGSVVTHEIWLDVTDKHLFPAIENLQTSTPKLTIVINESGNDQKAVKPFLDLPVPVTLAISPWTAYSRDLAEEAWKRGHEILIHQPMQSSQWPYVKAGPDEITVDMSDETMAAILHTAQDNVPHASGLTNHMGSRLSTDSNASARLVAQTAAAGLYLLDSMVLPDSRLYPEAIKRKLPAWKQDIALDEGHPPMHAVLSALKKAEQLAAKQGYAIVCAQPYPETLEALRRWAADRDNTITIVPLRALPRPLNIVNDLSDQ